METARPNKGTINAHYIDALDGLRALSALIVVWYHIWQQSWLSPVIPTPFLAFLGRRSISLDIVPRAGFLFVELLMLLSGFCLFLPYARHTFFGEPAPTPLAFYKKRLIRIVPSYYLSVLLLFFFYALPQGLYDSGAQMARDLASTLTFTQTALPEVLIATKLNGVLWTVAVEMQFYLLFPLLAYAFGKKPLLTYLAMVAVSFAYIYGYVLPRPDTVRIAVNQLPGFLGVFANGMLGAYLFVFAARRFRRGAVFSICATAAFFVSIYAVSRILYAVCTGASTQANQLTYRFALSFCFLVLTLSAALSARWLRFLLSNRIMRFLAGISYNMYIWHQWICVRLKAARVPYWPGELLPNLAGNRVWQQRYTLLAFGCALVAGVLFTYCFERPVAKRLSDTRFVKQKEEDDAVSA